MPKSTSVSAAARGRRAETTAQSSSASQWPASTIPETATITKGDAVNRYRLSPKILAERLTHTTQPSKNKEHKPMHLYVEREVEQLAWEKHGGRDGFKAHLKKLEGRYAKAHPGKEFLQPLWYGDLAPVISRNSAIRSREASLRQIATSKASGCSWLWDDCIRIARHDLDYVAMAMEFLPSYPPRPAPLVDWSPSFSLLQSVLERAPPHGGYPGMKIPNCEIYEDGFDGSISCYWTDEYASEVCQAAIRVIEAHGVGPQGWEIARWMIYDAFSNINGICISSWLNHAQHRGAYDEAHFWLTGRVPDREVQFLPFLHNTPPEVWRQYNALLPPCARAY